MLLDQKYAVSGLTFRYLLQPGEHLGQLLLPLCQLAPAREVHTEECHDGVYDLSNEGQGGVYNSETQRVHHVSLKGSERWIQ